MEIKYCNRCKIAKSLDQFGNNKSRIDGLQCECKTCRAKIAHTQYLKNPAKFKENTKRWIKNHREIVNARARRYHLTHKKLKGPIWVNTYSDGKLTMRNRISDDITVCLIDNN